MTEERIIAVSFAGIERLQNLSHVWTTTGALATQRAVEDLWARRCRYYVVMPTGRVDIAAVPRRVPNPVTALFGKRFRGHLEAARGSGLMDGLLTLPRLPSPARPRRSRAQANATI